MKATGRKMTTSDSVVAITGSATSRVPWIAASNGVQPFSSMYRKMFSSTTIASSMTMPTASVSAEQRHVVQREVHARISVNVATIDAGIASAEMITARMFRMKNITTSDASRLPHSRCSSSDSIDA